MVEEQKIKLTIRQNNGTSFDVSVSSNATVTQLKEACVEQSTIPADEQRLIFKGKILKDE
jgi:ubiquilin